MIGCGKDGHKTSWCGISTCISTKLSSHVLLHSLTCLGMKELPTPFCGWGKSELTIIKELIPSLNSKESQKLGHKDNVLLP